MILDRLTPVVDSSRHALEFAPQPQVRRHLVARLGTRYHALDLLPDTPVDVLADAQSMPFASERFDLVVCYHVLEHVRDDRAALTELHRVLSPAGLAIVQVPWRPERSTDEDPDAPEFERIERFGQADHVRYYGGDFEDLLTDHGLYHIRIAPEQVLAVEDIDRLALVPDEDVWLCTRHPLGTHAGDADVFAALTTELFKLERQYSARLHRDLVETLDRARQAESLARAHERANKRLRSHPAVQFALRARRILRGGRG